jgi:hypothetical protein
MLSAAPGRIIGEWRISDRDRCTAENMRKIKKEIMDALHLCPCTAGSAIVEIR